IAIVKGHFGNRADADFDAFGRGIAGGAKQAGIERGAAQAAAEAKDDGHGFLPVMAGGRGPRRVWFRRGVSAPPRSVRVSVRGKAAVTALLPWFRAARPRRIRVRPWRSRTDCHLARGSK